MREKPESKPFLWLPGQGSDAAADLRMRVNFQRPRAPMGEAWFMGETRGTFAELMGDPLDAPLGDIHDALFELSSGTFNFGPRDEWRDWFHYLLAQTVGWAHHRWLCDYHIEPLITAFISQYPEGIKREPYRGFRADALATLGRAMMNPDNWEGDRARLGAFLNQYSEPLGLWRWDRASGDFSASMFFCLKYLEADEIGPWLQSVFAIPDPYWRAQIMVWFLGAHGLLRGETPDPSKYELGDRPGVVWSNAHVLIYSRPSEALSPGAEFLPRANREAALAAMIDVMSDERFLDWMCSIAEIAELEAELAELPDAFYALYVFR